MQSELTRVWVNAATGHHYAEGPRGAELNGFPAYGLPDWCEGRAPDAFYGPLIQWNGGKCPVPPDTLVRCIFRGRRPYLDVAIWPHLPERAKESMWMHAPAPGRVDPDFDIIAYQVRVA